jgi:hypothetical protein
MVIDEVQALDADSEVSAAVADLESAVTGASPRTDQRRLVEEGVARIDRACIDAGVAQDEDL